MFGVNTTQGLFVQGQSGYSALVISLTKGGGAIRGIS